MPTSADWLFTICMILILSSPYLYILYRILLKVKPERKDLHLKYDELIMAVENKYPNESRHETALRYIEERENCISRTANVIGIPGSDRAVCFPNPSGAEISPEDKGDV